MISTRDTLLNQLKVENAHEAWKEFYSLYWGAILRYARKLGLNEHEAEEVLQDTMVNLIRILPGFVYDQNRGRFRNFLLTIVHRKSLAVLRRRRRDRDSRVPWVEVEGKEGPKTLDADVEPGREAVDRWRESLVAEALAELRADPTLGEQTFAVFEAYVVGKRPAAEVAVEFGLKENAVYQIKNRLIRRLERRVASLMRSSGIE